MASRETTALYEHSPNSMPTPELVRKTVEEARELLLLEVRLAREEAREDFVRYRRLGYEMGAALLLCSVFFGGLVLSAAAREAKALAEAKRNASRWTYRMAG